MDPGAGPNQNLTLNEPIKLTLTLPPILILNLNPTKPKPKIHSTEKAWARCTRHLYCAFLFL